VKVILFDFDGTIADSFEVILSIANRLAAEYGYPRVEREDIHQLQRLTSREVVQRSGISIWRLLFLLRRLRRELNKEIVNLQPFPYIRESLMQLKQKGYKLGIVTSNSTENVEAFLRQNQMQDLFELVVSGLTLFGKGKIIGRVIQQNRLNPADIIYVGDETRDIEAARRVGVSAISVSWGFSSDEVLARESPDCLVHHPKELIEAVESFV